MKLQLLIVFCIIMSFAAAGDEGMDKFCKLTPDELQQLESKDTFHRQRTRECLQELQPKASEARSACNIEVFGSDLKSLAEVQKVHCPTDPAKMKALEDCLTNSGIKKLTGEEKQEHDSNNLAGFLGSSPTKIMQTKVASLFTKLQALSTSGL
ncbi:hypothetical protein BGZ68_006188 [Mortierella alpina]|nr:hypothetical protein BGZ68_006188 [Mortierella alpina]